MAERPTPEQLAEWRAWIEGGLDEESPVEALTGLLAEVDALTATEEHSRALLGAARAYGKAEFDRAEAAIARAVAAEQRAGTAELAWTELHRAAVSFEAALSEWCDGPLRDALWKALAAKPTDLAEAQRRELRAEGMEEVAVMLERVGEGRSSRATKAMAAAMRGGAK